LTHDTDTQLTDTPVHNNLNLT